MCALWNRFRREEKGIAVTELALVTPIFLLLFLSTIELGHMIYYHITVEKALRSAVTYAGRNEYHTPEVEAATKNIVRTGEPSGTADYLVRGWADPDATVTFVPSQYTETVSGSEDLVVTVVTVTADVPYEPIVGVLVPALEFLMHSQLRHGKVWVTRMHQQAIIGN